MELPRVEYRCWKEWVMKKCIQSSLSDQVSTMLKEQILNGQLKGRGEGALQGLDPRTRLSSLDRPRSASMRENDIIITYGSDASAMTRALLDAIDIEHLITDTKATIVLQPNLVVAVTPGRGDHPPRDRHRHHRTSQGTGYRNITIAESAWIGDSTERGLLSTGTMRSASDTTCRSST